MERMTNGVLYDEYNHKPLVFSYDIVLHHKQELTMSNVNDASVSLNPENIMIVSQTSHNEIHSRFGYNGRKVYYVWGSPCSGKTTFVNSIKGNSDLVVDIDNIWECLVGERYVKPAALKQNVFAIRDMLYDQVRKRAGKWERAFIITSGAVESIRNREIESFGAEEIHIDTDKQTCLQRLYSDNERNHKEWEQYIEQWWCEQ